jgi:hypothetical protein
LSSIRELERITVNQIFGGYALFMKNTPQRLPLHQGREGIFFQ